MAQNSAAKWWYRALSIPKMKWYRVFVHTKYISNIFMSVGKFRKTLAIKCKELFWPSLFNIILLFVLPFVHFHIFGWFIRFASFSISFRGGQNSILVMDFVIKYRIIILNAAARMLVGAYFVVTKIKTITQRSSLTLFLLTRILLAIVLCLQVAVSKLPACNVIYMAEELKCVRV